MDSFDVHQCVLDRHANGVGGSHHQPQNPWAGETLLTRTHSAQPLLDKPDLQSPSSKVKDGGPHTNTESGVSGCVPNVSDSKERETVRLQCALTNLKTANKAKEVLLRSTREELKNARETLNETFAEYSSLRDEMKMIKQSFTRDHQAIVYQKDIELLALRKGNEQKEQYIKEHDAKLDEVYQQQKATVELKDAQLKMLKERLAFLERQGSPIITHESSDQENTDGDQALEVRLLRVRKGKAPGAGEEEDAIIAKLQEQLALVTKAADEVVNQQAELQRAWDIARKIQATLKDERELHAQTKEQLQELTVRLEEESQRSLANSLSRLPTIEEDKNELEAMFDTAQEDNLRLYGEVEALEKRLRDANARVFTAEQEAKALREQVKLEKAISEDFETARPSVVHRVHFQRMEGQLKESRDMLAEKDEMIDLLKSTIAGKDHYIKDLQAEVDAAVNFHTKDQDEIELLKQSITELQATKDRLMRDHERLASQRVRQRVASAEHTSARSSGVTLIHDMSPQLTRPSYEPAPTEALPLVPVSAESDSNDSIQVTPKRHLRSGSTPNRWSLMSNNVPPPELRHSRRKSLGLKDLMRRIVKKNATVEKVTEKALVKEQGETERPKSKAALATKDKNALLRPKTAAPTATAPERVTDDPFYRPTSVPVQQVVRPSNERRHTPTAPRYYAAQTTDANEKPQTTAGDAKATKDDHDATRPISRRSWGATNKLKRRTVG